MVTPDEFRVIVQGPDAAGRPTCRGVADAPVVLPGRVAVDADPRMANDAIALEAEIWTQVSALGQRSGSCHGPKGLGCWAMRSPIAFNLLVAVCGPPPFDPALEARVKAWVAAGGSALAVFRAGVDPQLSLPPSLRNVVGVPFHTSATEVATDVVDLVLLAGEERRAFISYAHQDGSQTAFAVFDALARRRFEVYLDRFRTAPSTDFVERIDDELRDKAMVVVIESAEAAKSVWVLHEVAAAVLRGYGLLAVNIGNAPRHPWIPPSRRLSLPTLREDVVCDEVERHYQAAVLDQRRRRSQTLEWALRAAIRRGPGTRDVATVGDRCDLLNGAVEYSVLGSFRPAGLHEARRVSEAVDGSGRRAAVYCPRPARPAAQVDQAWIDEETRVAVIPDGRLLRAAAEMVDGTF